MPGIFSLKRSDYNNIDSRLKPYILKDGPLLKSTTDNM